VHIEVWGDTDRGQRPENQDTIYFARPGKQGVTQEQINQYGYLLAVADGVAGNLGGKEASQAIINHLIAAYYNEAVGTHPGDRLSHAIQLANQQARGIVPAESATTLVTAVISNNQLHVANIGDSRLYWLHNNQIQQLTDDHIQQDRLARYLISLPGVRPDRFLLPQLNPGDRILLCSDGLYSSITNPSDIYQLAQGNVKRAIRNLIREANRLSGHDNISVILASVGEQRSATKDWQTIMIAVLLPILGLLVFGIYLGLSEFSQDRALETPTLMPTAAVPTSPFSLSPSPEIVPIATDYENLPTAASDFGRATATLVPTRTATPTATLTLTATSTPLPPTLTPTSTSTPFVLPSYTSTSVPATEAAPIETPTLIPSPTIPPP
jgi:PPM family protein phosphatase